MEMEDLIARMPMHVGPVDLNSLLSNLEKVRVKVLPQKRACIGQGGYAKVFVYGADNETKIAGKKMQLFLTNRMQNGGKPLRKALKHAINEVEQLRNLEHENIIKFLGCYWDSKQFIILTELMNGSIESLISLKNAPLTETQMFRFATQTAVGLNFLHSRNPAIIHRDIKCSNLLLDKKGNVKLADFGISLIIALEDDVTKTTQQTAGWPDFQGTILFAAPEVRANFNGQAVPYGRKADVWSLACAIVEMLTTKPPYHAEFLRVGCHAFVAQCGIRNRYPYSGKLVPDCLSSTRYLLDMMFEIDRKLRPSIKDCLHQLRFPIQQLSPHSKAESSTSSTKAPFASRRQKISRRLRDLKHQLLGSASPSKLPFIPSGGIFTEAQIEALPYDTKFEINRDLLSIDEDIPLGEGQFGQVFSGQLHSSSGAREKDTAFSAPLAVAIKVPRHGNSIEQLKALIIELKIMLAIGEHVNVLGIVGAVTKLIENGELYIVTELCALGNVQAFLRQKRQEFVDEIVGPDGYIPVSELSELSEDRIREWFDVRRALPTQYELQTKPDTFAGDIYFDLTQRTLLTTADLLSFSYQAANGMMFLGEESERKLIHRDLAARNLLLTANRTIKIADFGLARQYQTYRMTRSKNIPLPIKWMALESIIDHDFSVKSDVWSFGVVLWEMFSLGLVPYPDKSLDMAFINCLQAGYRMQKPACAPDEIYELMKQCWLHEPDKRPSFRTCLSEIGQQLERCNRSYKTYLDSRLNVQVVRTAQQGNNSSTSTTNRSFVLPKDLQEKIEQNLSTSEPDVELNDGNGTTDFRRLLLLPNRVAICG